MKAFLIVIGLVLMVVVVALGILGLVWAAERGDEVPAGQWFAFGLTLLAGVGGLVALAGLWRDRRAEAAARGGR